jgi:hypothetical protein
MSDSSLILPLALTASTTSCTIAKAKIFLSFRIWLAEQERLCELLGWKKRQKVWGKLFELFSCPYCLSHWITFLLVVIYRPRFFEMTFPVVDLVVSAFTIIALATAWSILILQALALMDKH